MIDALVAFNDIVVVVVAIKGFISSLELGVCVCLCMCVRQASWPRLSQYDASMLIDLR